MASTDKGLEEIPESMYNSLQSRGALKPRVYHMAVNTG